VASPADWLGGTNEGPFAGRGPDNVAALLEGRIDGFRSAWHIEDRGRIAWTIRTHANHFESIRSCYLKAVR
jgi:hypothetical protein